MRHPLHLSKHSGQRDEFSKPGRICLKSSKDRKQFRRNPSSFNTGCNSQVSTNTCSNQVSCLYIVRFQQSNAETPQQAARTLKKRSACQIPSFRFSCTKLFAIKLLKNFSFVVFYFSLAHKNKTQGLFYHSPKNTSTKQETNRVLCIIMLTTSFLYKVVYSVEVYWNGGSSRVRIPFFILVQLV